VRQLDSAARSLLVSLAASCPRLLDGAATWTYVDVDSLLRRTYGKAKQGAGFGHTKVGGYPVLLRGLSPLVATVSTDTAAPVIAATRLRGGNAGSARGAASLVAEALGVVREVGGGTAPSPGGVLLLRGGSAFYTGTVVSAARRHDARFSITVSMNPAVRRAIAVSTRRRGSRSATRTQSGTQRHGALGLARVPGRGPRVVDLGARDRRVGRPGRERLLAEPAHALRVRPVQRQPGEELRRHAPALTRVEERARRTRPAEATEGRATKAGYPHGTLNEVRNERHTERALRQAAADFDRACHRERHHL
jgi:hypothetical protein